VKYQKIRVNGILYWRQLCLLLTGLITLSLIPSSAVSASATGKIAFVANLEGNWDLFIMDGDGRNLVQLTKTPVDERAPSISPDGEEIVYSTSDGALWVVNLATKQPFKLPLPEGRYNHPSWSPDGQEIIYTSYTLSQGGEDADIWIYSVAEKSPRQFVKQPGLQSYPRFSPKGDMLIYSSSQTITLLGFEFTAIEGLWKASLRDGEIKQLLLGNARDTEPAWSPDGRRVVFSSDRSGNPDLWLITSDGKELTQLTNSPAAEMYPKWSPDGLEIVYISAASGRTELSLINVNTREARKVTPFGAKNIDIRDPDYR